jgi:ClpP class serine protease
MHGRMHGDKASAVERIRPLADGRVLTGEQAVAAGLADRFGYLFDGIEVARRLAHIEKTPQVIRYERDNGLFGFSEQEKNTHINAGIEINGGALALPFHARLEYRWASW